MSKKTIRSYVKNLNREVLKLSWVYLIVMSLLLLLFLQIYRNVMNEQNKPIQNQVDRVIESLEQRVHYQESKMLEQEQVIENLRNEIEKLKND